MNIRGNHPQTCKLLIAVAIAVIIAWLAPIATYAIDWVKLEPQEVIERAELVVQGRYNFDEPRHQGDMWHYYSFEVVQVIAGDAPDAWQAGIELHDDGRALDHQEKGGQFILFLEKESRGRYIPVAGPNGMIEIMDGAFTRMDESEAQTYMDYFQSHNKNISTGQPTTASYPEDYPPNNKAGMIIAVIVVAAFASAAIIAFMLLRRSNSNR